MKEKNNLFLITLLMLVTFNSANAMQMQIGHLDGAAAAQSSSSDDQSTATDQDTDIERNIDNINRDSSFHYPGNVSFILGYSRTNVKNGEMNNVSITPVVRVPTFSFQNKSIGLNGITLGINQFLTYHFGYELFMSYYLAGKNNQSYSGTYDIGDPPNLVNANANTTTKLLTTELLGMAGLHLTKNILLVGKLGVGYERLNQASDIGATFVRTPDTYVPYSDTVKQNKFGLAGGAELRFDLNENFSLAFGVNDLHAKQNMLAYQANLLMRL